METDVNIENSGVPSYPSHVCSAEPGFVVI